MKSPKKMRFALSVSRTAPKKPSSFLASISSTQPALNLGLKLPVSVPIAGTTVRSDILISY